MFHFFQARKNDGTKVLPKSKIISISRGKTTSLEATQLNLEKDEKVVRIKRCRFLNNTPVISQKITLPVSIFGSLKNKDDIGNNLYDYYQTEFNIKVIRTIDKFRAASIDKEHAGLLQMDENSVILELERTAVALDDRPVEWSLSYMLTNDYYLLLEKC